MKRLIPILILAAVLLLAVSSCGETKPQIPMIELADWQEYVLMRSDTAGAEITEASLKLNRAIEEKLGTKLKPATDFVKKNEPVPTGTKEILIGTTNRPESDVELGYLDYTVRLENGRVIINGGCTEAVDHAVDWFIANCIGETLCVPAEAYVYTETYPLAGVTVDGVPLSDYGVSMYPQDPDLSASLAKWIAVNTGGYPDSDHARKIILRENPAPV